MTPGMVTASPPTTANPSTPTTFVTPPLLNWLYQNSGVATAFSQRANFRGSSWTGLVGTLRTPYDLWNSVTSFMASAGEGAFLLVDGTWAAFHGDYNNESLIAIGKGILSTEAAAKNIGSSIAQAAQYLRSVATDLWNIWSNPNTARAVIQGDFSNIQMQPETQVILKLVGSSVLDVLTAVQKKAQSMSAEQWAYISGRIIGNIGYQIAESVVTAGATTALKAGKLSEGLYKLQSNPLVKYFDDSGAISKILYKTADNIAFVLNTDICFVAGTKIHTLDGLKNIEDIKRGDLVLTQFESDYPDVAGPLYRPVLQTFETHPDELLHVSVRNKLGRRGDSGNHSRPPILLGLASCVRSRRRIEGWR